MKEKNSTTLVRLVGTKFKMIRKLRNGSVTQSYPEVRISPHFVQIGCTIIEKEALRKALAADIGLLQTG